MELSSQSAESIVDRDICDIMIQPQPHPRHPSVDVIDGATKEDGASGLLHGRSIGGFSKYV